MSNPNDETEELSSIGEAEWEWLKPHLERDSLIIVSQDLDLSQVAEKVSADDRETIQGWINKGRLTKPEANQVANWDASPRKRFLMIIRQPYVLIQEKSH